MRYRYFFLGVFNGPVAPVCRVGSQFQVTHMTTIEAITTDRKTISIIKASVLVGVSRRTIYNWIASGKVEYVRTAGGSVRIFVDTLWRTPEDPAISGWDSGGAGALPSSNQFG